MSVLLLATTNPGKVREFRDIIARFPELDTLRVVTPYDLNIVLPDVEETGDTFAANASLKARSAADASGWPALADDSGLCVDALNGAPGVLSARWAGPNASDATRMSLLLEKMAAVPTGKRAARFVCVAALALPHGGSCLVEEGICEGWIAWKASGTRGFGYDPLFVLPKTGRTMAQLSDADKNRKSHRAQALHKLRTHFAALTEKTLSPARLERFHSG